MRTCLCDPLAVCSTGSSEQGETFPTKRLVFDYTELNVNRQVLWRGGRPSHLQGAEEGASELALGHAGSREQARRKVVRQRCPAAPLGFQFKLRLTSCRSFCAGPFLGSICRRLLMSAKLAL